MVDQQLLACVVSRGMYGLRFNSLEFEGIKISPLFVQAESKRETMMDKKLPMPGSQSFEQLKQSNAHGAEYWSARDLQPMLGYSQWRRFEDAVKRAMTSCEASGNSAGDHFAGAGKPIEFGKGGRREVEDYHLSRFGRLIL